MTDLTKVTFMRFIDHLEQISNPWFFRLWLDYFHNNINFWVLSHPDNNKEIVQEFDNGFLSRLNKLYPLTRADLNKPERIEAFKELIQYLEPLIEHKEIQEILELMLQDDPKNNEFFYYLKEVIIVGELMIDNEPDLNDKLIDNIIEYLGGDCSYVLQQKKRINENPNDKSIISEACATICEFVIHKMLGEKSIPRFIMKTYL